MNRAEKLSKNGGSVVRFGRLVSENERTRTFLWLAGPDERHARAEGKVIKIQRFALLKIKLRFPDFEWVAHSTLKQSQLSENHDHRRAYQSRVLNQPPQPGDRLQEVPVTVPKLRTGE
jgi:hypothetical protein